MTTIKNRVMQLIERKGLAKEKFFKDADIASAGFRGKQANSALNSDAIARIMSIIPDLNLNWLITGKGEMLHSEQIRDPVVSEPQPAAVPAGIVNAMDYLAEANKAKDAEIEKLTKERDELRRKLKESGGQSAATKAIPSKEPRDRT